MEDPRSPVARKNEILKRILTGTEPNRIVFGDVVITQSLGRPFAAPSDANLATQRRLLRAAGRTGEELGL